MKQKLNTLHQRLTGTVLGSEEPAYLILVALLSQGHVLIQGAPGIGKTSLAKTLAQSISGSFKRIQFTPDLLPADILGYSMYHQGTGEFHFIDGPVFSNVLLADEINRTSPRIQSALLECMNEGQVSIDGVTRTLQKPFMVLATQNNRYASGTFPLPEPQLDRFIVSINMQLPEAEVQTEILMLHSQSNPDAPLAPIVGADELHALQKEVATVLVNENVCRYITSLCEAARHHKSLGGSLSARASIALMRAAQAVAYLENHSTVHPDDVKKIAIPVLQHRLAGRETGSSKSTRVALEDVLLNTPVT